MVSTDPSSVSPENHVFPLPPEKTSNPLLQAIINYLSLKPLTP